MTPHAENKTVYHNEISVLCSRHEPTFVVEGPAHFDYVENAPRNNAVIAQDYWRHDRPLMRRAWFCEAALADIGQVFGGGN